MNPSLRNSLLAASVALSLSGLALAQSTSMDAPLTAPNNSAGTPLDIPTLHMPAPMRDSLNVPSRTDNAASAFDKLDAAHRGYVTRAEVELLPESIKFDLADRNNDGRLDADEFQQAWNEHGSGSQ